LIGDDKRKMFALVWRSSGLGARSRRRMVAVAKRRRTMLAVVRS
jgi:hypothetical protein